MKNGTRKSKWPGSLKAQLLKPRGNRRRRHNDERRLNLFRDFRKGAESES